MRTLAKARIKDLKSAYIELDKDILCELLATIIYILSQNGISVDIKMLSQNQIKHLIDNGLHVEADEILKKPIIDKIHVDCSKHDDDILLEFIHKVMSVKESEVNNEQNI